MHRVWLLLLLGCSSAAPPRGAPSCSDRIDAMNARLNEGLRLGDVARFVAPGIDLPRFDRQEGLPIDQDGPRLDVTADALVLDGRRMSSAEDVLRDLDTLARDWTILHRPQRMPYPLYVVADSSVPIARVAEITDQRSGTYDVELVIVAPPDPFPVAPPDASPQLIARVRGISAEQDDHARANAIHSLLRNSAARCARVSEAYGFVAMARPSERASTLVAHLTPAVRACGCETVDVPALEAAVLLTFGIDRVEHGRRSIHLPSSIVPSLPALRLQPTQTWGELARAMAGTE